MKKVIFICMGNQFRSPIAKALYNKYKKDDSKAESYGMQVDHENVAGHKLSSFPHLIEVIELLEEKEAVDNSHEICKQLTPEIVKSADKVVFLDIDQVPNEYKDKGYIYWHVKDYYDNSLNDDIIENKIEEIKKLVLELINGNSTIA